MKGYKLKRTIVGQLPKGADLLEGMTAFVQKEHITVGRIYGLGATTHAVVAYYNQQQRQYNPIQFPGGMEILSLHGNVSTREGKPFVHAHILLGDPQGNVFGGHLLPGTILFACELFVDELEGEELIRQHDEKTGLFLWSGGKLA